MSYRIETAFRDLVLANDAVSASAIGKRLYPNRAPHWAKDKEPAAYAVYFKVSSVPDHYIRAASRVTQTRMQVDVYATDYGQAQDAADAIRLACDGYKGTVSGTGGALELHQIELDDLRDQFEPDEASGGGWHRVSMDLMIWHGSTVPQLA